MSFETESGEEAPPVSGSPREQELEAKLNRRTMWVGLFAFIALTELIIMLEVLRQAN